MYNKTMKLMIKSIALINKNRYKRAVFPGDSKRRNDNDLGYDLQQEDLAFVLPLCSWSPDVFTSKSSLVVNSLQNKAKNPFYF